MVPWWKRLLYSLVSVTVAAFVCDSFLSIAAVFMFPSQHYAAAGFFPGLGIVLVFSLPGWVLAIPVVLIVTNIRGWRFWVYFAIGCTIGPLLMFGIAIYEFLSDPPEQRIIIRCESFALPWYGDFLRDDAHLSIAYAASANCCGFNSAEASCPATNSRPTDCSDRAKHCITFAIKRARSSRSAKSDAFVKVLQDI